VGLADNWSQVRMAASVAGRKFLMTMDAAAREPFNPLLVPRMVLNRFAQLYFFEKSSRTFIFPFMMFVSSVFFVLFVFFD
jgi:hypothetical protein